MINTKVENLELLRAIAVIAVCFCHFGAALSYGNAFANIFDAFHKYGAYGVQVFFVVSGFVIPLSLKKSRYSIDQYGRFLLKRVIRLHPPYLVALALSLIIGYTSYRARNLGFPETIESIFLSMFYLHISEINPVFWTLVVEAQYYMLIGITYGLLTKYPRLSLSIGIPVLLLIGQSPVAEYIRLFAFINFFLIGWVVFLIYTKQGSLKFNFIGLVALLIIASLNHEIPAVIASLFTVAVILFYRLPIPSAIAFPGKLSYSIYLIHYPIGVKFINLTSRYISPSVSWTLFPVAMLLVGVVAWAFWRLIEAPSAELSSAVKYAHSSQMARASSAAN